MDCGKLEVLERGHRIRLGPETDVAGRRTVGGVFDEELVVHVTRNPAAIDGHPQPAPLVSRDRSRDRLPFESAVIDELEENQIVLQGVDPEHKIVADVPDPEGQAAGLVDLAGRRLDMQGNLAFLYKAVLGDRDGKIKVRVDGIQELLVLGAQHARHHAGHPR